MSSSSDAPTSDSTPEAERSRTQSQARESRLSFRNFAEHTLRRELKDEAMEVCDPQIKVFAECAQEQGLAVVYTCRDLFKEVNACMAIHNGEEAWEKYKALHEDELDRRAHFRKK